MSKIIRNGEIATRIRLALTGRWLRVNSLVNEIGLGLTTKELAMALRTLHGKGLVERRYVSIPAPYGIRFDGYEYIWVGT
jgi:hypothetical protein